MLDVHAQAIQNARVCAETLDDANIRYAVTGGLAVQNYASRKPRGFAHWRAHVDMIVSRREAERVKEVLLNKGIRVGAFADGDTENAEVRLLFSENEALLRDSCLEPSVLGFKCQSLQTLLEMKLKTFRSRDRVHVQDLMEQKLITKKVEAGLAPELRARLEQVKDDTKREALG